MDLCKEDTVKKKGGIAVKSKVMALIFLFLSSTLGFAQESDCQKLKGDLKILHGKQMALKNSSGVSLEDLMPPFKKAQAEQVIVEGLLELRRNHLSSPNDREAELRFKAIANFIESQGLQRENLKAQNLEEFIHAYEITHKVGPLPWPLLKEKYEKFIAIPSQQTQGQTQVAKWEYDYGNLRLIAQSLDNSRDTRREEQILINFNIGQEKKRRRTPGDTSIKNAEDTEEVYRQLRRDLSCEGTEGEGRLKECLREAIDVGEDEIALSDELRERKQDILQHSRAIAPIIAGNTYKQLQEMKIGLLALGEKMCEDEEFTVVPCYNIGRGRASQNAVFALLDDTKKVITYLQRGDLLYHKSKGQLLNQMAYYCNSKETKDLLQGTSFICPRAQEALGERAREEQKITQYYRENRFIYVKDNQGNAQAIPIGKGPSVWASPQLWGKIGLGLSSTLDMVWQNKIFGQSLEAQLDYGKRLKAQHWITDQCKGILPGRLPSICTPYGYHYFLGSGPGPGSGPGQEYHGLWPSTAAQFQLAPTPLL